MVENRACVPASDYDERTRICAGAALRILFCHRGNREDVSALLRLVSEEAVEAMILAGRTMLQVATLVAVGSRSESETFPFGRLCRWTPDTNTGRSERL